MKIYFENKSKDLGVEITFNDNSVLNVPFGSSKEFEINENNNLNKVNKCGVVSAQTNSVTTTSSAYLPSNKISGGSFSEADTANTCVHDTDTHYYSSGSTDCVPSPYLSDDSRNPMYYTTSASTANCLSDFDGVGNTNTLVSLHTIDDLTTATTVTNNTRKYCCASGSLLSSI